VYGEVEVWPQEFLTSPLDAVERSASRPFRLNAGETAPGTHWIGDWVGPRAVMYAVAKRKTTTPAKNRTPIVQPAD
jgi:hypothetical protein